MKNYRKFAKLEVNFWLKTKLGKNSESTKFSKFSRNFQFWSKMENSVIFVQNFIITWKTLSNNNYRLNIEFTGKVWNISRPNNFRPKSEFGGQIISTKTKVLKFWPENDYFVGTCLISKTRKFSQFSQVLDQ